MTRAATPPATWPAFERRLAATLARLPARHNLILEARPSGRYVQYSQGGPKGFLMETQSNDFAASSDRLSSAEEAALVALGWNPPPADRDHHENFLRDWDPPAATPYGEIAHLTVRTFREIYRVATPSELRYAAFDRSTGEYRDPALGLEPLPAPSANRPRRVADGRGGTLAPRLDAPPPIAARAAFATFSCSACGKPAATVYLVPPGQPDPRLNPEPPGVPRGVSRIFSGAWQLSIDGGPVPVTIGPVREPAAAEAALIAGDVVALRRLPGEPWPEEYTPFYCPTCAKCYCADHWRTRANFDGPFFDDIEGWCPEDHRVLLAD